MHSAKIVKLRLTNYKVFDEININLNQCNVFIGPNSSGKTSIAEFLIFFRGLIRKYIDKGTRYDYDIEYFLKNAFRIGQDKPLIFEVVIFYGEYSYKYYVEIFSSPNIKTFWANEHFEIIEKKSKSIILEGSMDIKEVRPGIKGEIKFKGLGYGNDRSEIEKDFSYVQNSILKRFYHEGKNNINFDVVDQFYKFWDNIRLYDFNLYNKKEICKEAVISDEIILSEDFKNLMTVLLNINFKQKEIFDDILKWLTQLVPNFRDLIVQTSNEKGLAFLSFSEDDWNKKYAPLIQASDGIIRLLCILTVLFNKEKPTLIIFDEPENGIHPSIRNYIADFSIAASDDTQIIFLTHDSESLRQFEIEMIYYFKRKKGTTEIKLLSDEKSLIETIKALKDIEKNTIVLTHLTDSL